VDFNKRKNLLISFYRSKGFLDVVIENFEMRTILGYTDVYIKIQEGFLTTLKDIKVFGNTIFDDETILSVFEFKENSPLDLNRVYQKEITILDMYASVGYIYAKVNFDFISQENRYRKVLYVNIDEGQKTFLRNIYFDSVNFKNTKKIFEIETKNFKNKDYKPEDIYFLQRKIFSTNLFNSLNFKIDGIPDEKETLDVFFFGEEKKKNWISLSFLYQFPNKIKISTGIGNDNLFNGAEKLSLETSVSASFLFDQNFLYDKWFYTIFKYNIPYIYNTLFSLNLLTGFNIESNPNFLKRDLVTNLGVSRMLGSFSFSNNWYYRYSLIDTFYEDKSFRYEKTTTNLVNFNIIFNSRDELIFPRKGNYTSTKIEYAGGILRGYNNFYRFVYENIYYIGYRNLIVNSFRMRTGIIFPYGASLKNGISINEQFTLGGISSIRGVEQDSIGPLNDLGTHSGNFLVNLNYELRVIAYHSFGMVYFFDSGFLKEDFNFQMNIKDFVFAGGIGLFYNTFLGTIRFDIARPLNAQGNTKYYFNLGNPF